jgi:hypothetical protein
VRLRITDAAGTYYAPYGRLTEFATGVNQDVGGNVLIGTKKWCYIDGACEILLPPGQLHIEITKGFEYKPIDETITLTAGKMSLRFTIERWCDMRKDGWYSGDTRVHFLSPDAALLEGQGEDVAVVNLLACETEIIDQFGKRQRAIPNILSFSGQTFARQSLLCGVAVNTQNVHPQLGSLGLLHCHRVVYPLTFDSTDWTLDDWCGQCHRKKGLVVWTDQQHQTAEFLYGEPLADLILGNIDAFELTFFEDSPFDALADYYRLLDAGFVLPLAGASGKDGNGLVLGAVRTYACVSETDLSYGAWIDAVRKGHSFVSNGPLLRFSTFGPLRPENGMTLRVPSGDVEVGIEIEARSMVPFEHLELVCNGAVIASATPSAGLPVGALLRHQWRPRESGWLAARCRGATLLPSRPAPQRVFAHSAPLALIKDGRPDWVKPDAVRRFDAELERMSRWAGPSGLTRLVRVLENARGVLVKKLSS